MAQFVKLMKNYGKALSTECELISKPRKADVDEVLLSYGMKCHLPVNLGLICLLQVVFYLFECERNPKDGRWERCCPFKTALILNAVVLLCKYMGSREIIFKNPSVLVQQCGLRGKNSHASTMLPGVKGAGVKMGRCWKVKAPEGDWDGKECRLALLSLWHPSPSLRPVPVPWGTVNNKLKAFPRVRWLHLSTLLFPVKLSCSRFYSWKIIFKFHRFLC